MRIAQVAPLSESVPPKLYGGTERIVHYLTEELVGRGHDVTLFASGDSETTARLMPVVPKALRLDPRTQDPLAPHIVMLDRVARVAEDFDIIHFHVDYLHFPLFRYVDAPHVTTLHGRLDLYELQQVFNIFYDMPVISISNHQRAPLPMANWVATVHHGLPEDLYTFQAEPGRYLAFLGRISPEKRPDRAVEIAIRAGMPLKIAAKVDKADREYYESQIKPLLEHPLVDYVGELNEQEKNTFLGNAYALLFPIDWPEPFGLVMLEAMACGTPLIAYRNGSVPEVIRQDETGFIVDSIEQAVAAVGQISQISRARCRSYFEKNFSARRMADGYEAAYHQLIEARFERIAAEEAAGLQVVASARNPRREREPGWKAGLV